MRVQLKSMHRLRKISPKTAQRVLLNRHFGPDFVVIDYGGGSYSATYARRKIGRR